MWDCESLKDLKSNDGKDVEEDEHEEGDKEEWLCSSGDGGPNYHDLLNSGDDIEGTEDPKDSDVLDNGNDEV